MSTINSIFGGKIRTRICGLCFKEDSILLVKHNMDGKPFYAPPGGAVEFGENMQETLIREFMEETQLRVVPGKQIFITEFIRQPLHAIEVFFAIESWKGIPKPGQDPEVIKDVIILDVGFFSQEQINSIPKTELHHILYNGINPRDLLELSGYVAPSPYFNK